MVNYFIMSLVLTLTIQTTICRGQVNEWVVAQPAELRVRGSSKRSSTDECRCAETMVVFIMRYRRYSFLNVMHTTYMDGIT